MSQQASLRGAAQPSIDPPTHVRRQLDGSGNVPLPRAEREDAVALCRSQISDLEANDSKAAEPRPHQDREDREVTQRLEPTGWLKEVALGCRKHLASLVPRQRATVPVIAPPNAAEKVTGITFHDPPPDRLSIKGPDDGQAAV